MSQASASGVQMDAVSLEQFRCRVVHGPSGTQLQTEAPKDNGGTGASFSPTDLVGAALATCMLTTMALVAKREGVAWGEASANVEKRMTSAPRRIGELVVELRMPKELPVERRAQFEEVARTCPVARSLHPETKITERFIYA